MSDDKQQHDFENIKDINSQSFPRMCGTLLLWIGNEKLKQWKQKELHDSDSD